MLAIERSPEVAIACVALLLLGSVRQMEARAVGRTRLLQARRARLAQRLVARERARHVVRHRRQQRRQGRAVLDRLRGALRHHRQHRMAGVAQQRDPAVTPARQRQAIVQRPDEGLRKGLDQAAHDRMPALVARQHVGDVALVGPRFRRSRCRARRRTRRSSTARRDPVVHDSARPAPSSCARRLRCRGARCARPAPARARRRSR